MAKEITPEVAVSKKAVFIDVRTPEEHAEGHIEGDTFISIHSHTFLEEIETLDKTKEYVIYCRTGSRSLMAANQMEQAGFAHVYNLGRGIFGWKAAGKELVR